jgi:hypothetical protein
VVVEKISPTEKSHILCISTIGKTFWGNLRNWSGPTHQRLWGYKWVRSFEILLWEENTRTPCSYKAIYESVFLGSDTQNHCSHGPREPSYCLSWEQTLASPIRCWFYKHTECKSYRAMEASTKISKEDLIARQYVAGLESLQATLKG